MSRFLTIIIIGVLVLFFVTAILFLWKELPFDGSQKINETKFGTYGDFIGGILGGLTFALVVYSIILQQETNKNTRASIVLSSTSSIYDSIKREIEVFTKGDLKIKLDPTYSGNNLHDLNLILTTYDDLKNFLYKNNDVERELKNIYLNKLHLLFYTKILLSTFSLICGRSTDYPNDLFRNYVFLSLKTMEYLLSARLIPQSDLNNSMLEDLNTISETLK